MNIAAALARRIRMIIARSVVKLVDDSLKVQGLQLTVLADEVAQVERFQEYGFTSVPLEGAEAILAAVAGIRSHLVAIAVDDGRHRKKDLQPGEVALYTDEGDCIHFKRGQIIAVKAGNKVHVTAPEMVVTASTKVTIDSPEAHFTGKITAEKDITTDAGMHAASDIKSDAGMHAASDIKSDADVKAGSISLKHHVHISASPGDPTSPPQ